MKLIRSLAPTLGLFAVMAGSLFAHDESSQHKGLEAEARPPFHIKPFITASPTGLTAAQIRHAYGFDQITNNGAGQTIAIVDAFGSPTLQQDLNTFSDTFGLPRTTVRVVNAQGAPGLDSGWALETSLDVEWAHAIAPNATILVVVARTASFNNLLAAVDIAVSMGAKQVSMSWGSNEFSGEGAQDFHFNRSGVVFFASSGDNGAGVEWPAVSPNVVSVGGTTLRLNAQGNVLSETAWSGSGGGSSRFVARPGYQNGWQNTGGRGVPDVSYDADPASGFSVFIRNFNGTTGWITVGGTSAGAPQWAAIAALVNSRRAQSLSGWNTALYAEAAANYLAFYRDITSGNNGGFNAGARYDFVTGLGRPVPARLIPALVAR